MTMDQKRKPVAGKAAQDASSGGRRSPLLARKDGRTLRRMTLYLPADLARRLAVHCAERDVDMSAVVTDAVRRLLG
jgi:hypothetical protein